MKIFCGLLFILTMTISTAFAQTEKSQESQKFFEFGKISKSLLKEKTEDFFTELWKDTKSQGYIINYGTNKEVAKREKEIRDLIAFRNQDASRITFVRSDSKKNFLTELWIVPNGAEPPTP